MRTWLRSSWCWLVRLVIKPQPHPLPPPDHIGRPPTCANGVEGCGIKAPHGHMEALMRRLKEK